MSEQLRQFNRKINNCETNELNGILNKSVEQKTDSNGRSFHTQSQKRNIKNLLLDNNHPNNKMNEQENRKSFILKDKFILNSMKSSPQHLWKPDVDKKSPKRTFFIYNQFKNPAEKDCEGADTVQISTDNVRSKLMKNRNQISLRIKLKCNQNMDTLSLTSNKNLFDSQRRSLDQACSGLFKDRQQLVIIEAEKSPMFNGSQKLTVKNNEKNFRNTSYFNSDQHINLSKIEPNININKSNVDKGLDIASTNQASIKNININNNNELMKNSYIEYRKNQQNVTINQIKASQREIEAQRKNNQNSNLSKLLDQKYMLQQRQNENPLQFRNGNIGQNIVGNKTQMNFYDNSGQTNEGQNQNKGLLEKSNLSQHKSTIFYCEQKEESQKILARQKEPQIFQVNENSNFLINTARGLAKNLIINRNRESLNQSNNLLFSNQLTTNNLFAETTVSADPLKSNQSQELAIKHLLSNQRLKLDEPTELKIVLQPQFNIENEDPQISRLQQKRDVNKQTTFMSFIDNRRNTHINRRNSLYSPGDLDFQHQSANYDQSNQVQDGVQKQNLDFIGDPDSINLGQRYGVSSQSTRRQKMFVTTIRATQNTKSLMLNQQRILNYYRRRISKNQNELSDDALEDGLFKEQELENEILDGEESAGVSKQKDGSLLLDEYNFISVKQHPIQDQFTLQNERPFKTYNQLINTSSSLFTPTLNQRKLQKDVKVKDLKEDNNIDYGPWDMLENNFFYEEDLML